ncbi:MAG: hypothetical protein LBJ92_00745 [Holosporales bacterium]|nr:hypothetical protein [Holosporales bacterium]
MKKASATTGTSKAYRDVTLKDGILEAEAAADAMLIHRILQRKMIYSNLSTANQQRVFLRIFMNEANIKTGAISPCTATRDSIISFFTMSYVK